MRQGVDFDGFVLCLLVGLRVVGLGFGRCCGGEGVEVWLGNRRGCGCESG